MSAATLPEVQQQPQSKPQTLKGLLMSPQVQDQIATALPKHMTADRMVRAAMTAMLRTPDLARCDQTSFMSAMLQLSQVGLEPDGRMAHLIPFNNNKAGRVDCQLIIDYKGLVELVQRSGKVSTIHADVVCENDDFEYDMGEIKKHKIDFRKPRGPAYAAYARVVMKDGTSKCEVMNREEIEAIRNRSRAGQSGPWKTDWNEMAKKTVFRRCSKWLSLSSELCDAVEVDDDQFEHRLSVESIPDAPPVSRIEAAKAKVQRQQTQQVQPQPEHEPEPEEVSQDMADTDEVNRLCDAVMALRSSKEDRIKLYASFGCDAIKNIWPRSGVAQLWDWVSVENDANKQ